MTLGGRKISPSTSVAQLLGNRARSRQPTLNLHRESRRALLMHMAHTGRWFDNIKRDYNLWHTRSTCSCSVLY